MSDVSFTPEGPPETVLPEPDPELATQIEAAQDLESISTVAAAHPAEPLAWATFGDAARAQGVADITVYAYYRIGYHRGLDQLRQHGSGGARATSGPSTPPTGPSSAACGVSGRWPRPSARQRRQSGAVSFCTS